MASSSLPYKNLKQHFGLRGVAFAFAALATNCDQPQPAVQRQPVVRPDPSQGAEVRSGFTPARDPSHGDWNAAQIDWQPFEAALTRARSERKPICLVLHASWCGHCRNYMRVFEDPRIVERSRSFVMVHLDTDENPSVASRYQVDGQYVPRTFFLNSEGNPLNDIDAHRTQYRYFFDEHNPASLLGGMETAVQRTR